MQLIARQGPLTIWVRHNDQNDTYELFADREGLDYIGTAPTLREAKKVAKSWLGEYA
jgi:hypothetical protein